MSLVTARGLHLSFGKKVLFRDESFSIAAKDRVGLVGANGTGKSSLLRILSGTQQPESGELRFRKGSRVGYLPQELAQLPAGTLVESVLNFVPGRRALELDLERLEEAVSDADSAEDQLELSQELADRHAELEEFEDRFGKHRAEEILSGLGFSPANFNEATSTFSGGWRMRGALAGLLLQDPELLLLDEPTNHLDLPTLTWFEDFLRRSRRALILVSHDREFLDRQIDSVLALEVEGLRKYAGTYSDYRAQRVRDLEQLEARAARQQARRTEIQQFITRFGAKASKARQAQSRAKALEREEIIEVQKERDTVRFRFPPCPRAGREIVALRGIRKTFGDRIVYQSVDATVERGQRIAVVGVNGAGKTTLLKLIAGEIAPDAGTIAFGHNVLPAYYAQHHTDQLDSSATVIEEVRRLVPDKPESYVRGVLGAFLFSGDDIDKPIGILSGGEKARVALAKLLYLPGNFLLMDEPTNHLDVESSEALIQALKSYEGTILFVSHNRSFLNQLATQIWEACEGTIVRHPGNLDDYLYHLRQERLAPPTAQVQGEAANPGLLSQRPNKKELRRTEAEARNRRSALERPLRSEIERLESRIAAIESDQKRCETALADPVLYSDFSRAKPLMEAHRANKAELEALLERWEEHQKALASLPS